jgi:hypothetical protein
MPARERERGELPTPEDAKQKVAGVSPPGSQADGATISPSELKSLTQIPVDRKALDGPATRPNTPLAVENSVALNKPENENFRDMQTESAKAGL